MSPKVRDILFGASDSKEPKNDSKPVSDRSQARSESGTRTVPSTAASVTPHSVTPSVSPRAPEPQKQAKTPLPSTPQAPTNAPAQAQSTRRKRRPKNTVVVSLQMPAALVRVLDDIVDAGAYRSRSDVIMQAIRAHPEISRRLARLEAKTPPQKK